MVITGGECTYCSLGLNYQSSSPRLDQAPYNEILFASYYKQDASKIIRKRTLNQKIRSAASEVGIDSLIIMSWVPGTISTMGTRGVIRPADSTRIKEPIPEHDLGYFKAIHSGIEYDKAAPYTIESFIINPWPFSEVKLESFVEVLAAKGLSPDVNDNPFGSKITWNAEDHKEWNNRPILYK